MRVLSESSDVPFKQFTALCSFEFLEGALKKKKRTNLYAVIVLCSLKRDRICFSDLCRRNCDASGCRNFFEFFKNCVTVLVLLLFIVRFQQHNFIWYFFFFFLPRISKSLSYDLK